MGWSEFDAAAFYEELGQKYPEAKVVYSTLEGRLRRAFVRRFLQAHSGTLLDVGCNVGIHMESFAGRKIGVDIAPSVLAEAKKRIPDGTFYAGSAETMPFISDGSVDVVLCTEVLEHIEHPDAAMREFYRAVRPGGHALVSTPNQTGGQEDWIEAEILSDYGIQQQSYFHTAFTPERLAEMMSAAGFTVTEHGSFGREVEYTQKATYPICDFAMRVNHHTLKSPRMDHWIRAVYFRLQRAAYGVVVGLGLRNRLNRGVPQGKFSYVLAHKPA